MISSDRNLIVIVKLKQWKINPESIFIRLHNWTMGAAHSHRRVEIVDYVIRGQVSINDWI